MTKLSVVIPLFNEADSLPEIYRQLTKTLPPLAQDYELLFVDDGSTDASLKVLADLHHKDNHIKVISFSRNFGHMAALCAGLEAATGEAVISLDADLQHPVSKIPAMVEAWKSGVEV